MVKRLLLLMMTAVFVLTSCEGPMGPPGRDGHSTFSEVILVNIEENNWVLYEDQDGLNPFFMAEVDVPELNNDLYLDGNVQAYMILNPGKSNETQRPLNYSYPNENNHFEFWTEYYTFDFMPGSVAFYVHYSDFEVGITPPRQEFRIVLSW